MRPEKPEVVYVVLFEGEVQGVYEYAIAATEHAIGLCINDEGNCDGEDCDVDVDGVKLLLDGELTYRNGCGEFARVVTQELK